MATDVVAICVEAEPCALLFVESSSTTEIPPAVASEVPLAAPADVAACGSGEPPDGAIPGLKSRRTRLFVLTLGYSRESVRLLVWQ